MITRVNILFCLLLAICATVGAVMVTAEAPGGLGTAHPQFAAMLRGRAMPPPARFVVLGWLFGVLQIAVYVTCMTLGISRGGSSSGREASRVQGRRLAFLLYPAGTLAFLGVFTQMIRADRAAAISGTVELLGPFPAATSWMLFGLWAAPLLFVAAYLCGFSRWIIADEDLSRFDDLVARREHKSGTPS